MDLNIEHVLCSPALAKYAKWTKDEEEKGAPCGEWLALRTEEGGQPCYRAGSFFRDDVSPGAQQVWQARPCSYSRVFGARYFKDREFARAYVEAMAIADGYGLLFWPHVESAPKLRTERLADLQRYLWAMPPDGEERYILARHDVVSRHFLNDVVGFCVKDETLFGPKWICIDWIRQEDCNGELSYSIPMLFFKDSKEEAMEHLESRVIMARVHAALTGEEDDYAC